MKVKWKKEWGERTLLADVPVGEPFCLYRWHGLEAEMESVWVKIDGVSSIKRQYYKTPTRVKDDIVPILSLSTYTVHTSSNFNGVHPVEFINEPKKK